MTPNEILATYPDVNGYVYLLSCDGLHKIGLSINPLQRIRAVAPRHAELVHLIACDNPQVVESVLHRRFASKHVKGEWFNLLEHDIALIQSCNRLTHNDDIPEPLRPCHTTKHPSRGGKTKGLPIHVRLDPQILHDLQIVGKAHGFGISDALRMILVEARHPVVRRAKEVLQKRHQ